MASVLREDRLDLFVGPGIALRIGALLLRFLASSAVAFGVAVLAALALTILDLYLVGHGYPSINRELLAWRDGAVSMNIADIFLLLAALGAGCVTWLLLRRHAPPT